jgi:hypothetical protein
MKLPGFDILMPLWRRDEREDRESQADGPHGPKPVLWLRPVPSGARPRMEGRVVCSECRKHWTEAEILNARGTLLAQGKGLFIEMRAR